MKSWLGVGSRTAATSKMECFLIIFNGCKLLTIITKNSMLDVAAALDPPVVKNMLYNCIQRIMKENLLLLLKDSLELCKIKFINK